MLSTSPEVFIGLVVQERVGPIVPGNAAVSGSGTSSALFPQRVYFKRPYVELFKACDCAGASPILPVALGGNPGKPYYHWGKLAYASAYDESVGPADALPGVNSTLPIAIPIGYGTAIPIYTITLARTWAPGVSPGYSANTPTSAIRWTPFEDQLWNSDLTLVDHIRCDKAGSYWVMPPVPEIAESCRCAVIGESSNDPYRSATKHKLRRVVDYAGWDTKSLLLRRSRIAIGVLCVLVSLANWLGGYFVQVGFEYHINHASGTSTSLCLLASGRLQCGDRDPSFRHARDA